jgi:hypothetical protein
MSADMRPRLNDAMDIAFPYGGNFAGAANSGVWVNGANVITPLRPEINSNFAPKGSIGMSQNRRVVWYGSTSTGIPGIYSVDLASGSGTYHGQAPGIGYDKLSPQVNNAGVVAMFDSPSGLSTVARLRLDTNMGSPVPGLGTILPGAHSILDQNNAGQIVYLDRQIGRGMVRIEPDNSLTVLSPDWRNTYDYVTMNSSGDAAFFEEGPLINHAHSVNLVRYHDGIADVLQTAGAGQAFRWFLNGSLDPAHAPVVNDQGWVAFFGTPLGGTMGVYITDGTTTTRVFGQGDGVQTPLGLLPAVFGLQHGFDMNTNGDLLVHVGLREANGGVGDGVVLIRAVPTPGVAVTAMLACGLAAIRRRRR